MDARLKSSLKATGPVQAELIFDRRSSVDRRYEKEAKMMRSIVNKFMKAILDELFIDAGNVQMSMGPDLFSESTIHLKNLTFRPDIFDVCLQPLHLISGHLGKLSVDGIAELALGAGKIGCQVENIFLLFGVDENADAEQVQVMKKLLVELQGRGPISRTLLRDLMKKIQGFPAGKDPDVRKKRKLLLKGLNYLFKSLLMTVKSVHIRIEVKNRNSDVSAVPSDEKNVPRNHSSGSGKSKFPLCSAIGITIPQFKLTPNSSVSVRPDGVGKDDPILLFSLKSLQVRSPFFYFEIKTKQQFVSISYCVIYEYRVINVVLRVYL